MVRKRTLKQHKKKIQGIEDDVKYIHEKEYEKTEDVKLGKMTAKMKDEDLFVINQGKSDNIRANRKILAEDRFKTYNEHRSKYERDQIKKIMKNSAKEKAPKKVKNEVIDLWNTPDEVIGARHNKNFRKVREILDTKFPKVKRVVVPLAGQSYNPPATEHKKVIDQIADEMRVVVKQEQQLELELNPMLRPEAQNLDEKIAELKEKSLKIALLKGIEPSVKIDLDVGGEDGPTKLSVNPPVDRDDCLTMKGRKKRNEELRIKRMHIVEKRARQRVHKNRPVTKQKLKENKKKKLALDKMKEEEKKKWEKEGVVSNPIKTGIYKYKKPKTDFVPDDQLPDALRKQKGSENLILDQFDSFYRRSFLPKEPPVGDRKKIIGTQYKEHQTNAEKKMHLDEKRKGDKAKELAREKLRERKRKHAINQGNKGEKIKLEDDELIFL